MGLGRLNPGCGCCETGAGNPDCCCFGATYPPGEDKGGGGWSVGNVYHNGTQGAEFVGVTIVQTNPFEIIINVDSKVTDSEWIHYRVEQYGRDGQLKQDQAGIFQSQDSGQVDQPSPQGDFERMINTDNLPLTFQIFHTLAPANILDGDFFVIRVDAGDQTVTAANVNWSKVNLFQTPNLEGLTIVYLADRYYSRRNRTLGDADPLPGDDERVTPVGEIFLKDMPIVPGTDQTKPHGWQQGEREVFNGGATTSNWPTVQNWVNLGQDFQFEIVFVTWPQEQFAYYRVEHYSADGRLINNNVGTFISETSSTPPRQTANGYAGKWNKGAGTQLVKNLTHQAPFPNYGEYFLVRVAIGPDDIDPADDTVRYTTRQFTYKVCTSYHTDFDENLPAQDYSRSDQEYIDNSFWTNLLTVNRGAYPSMGWGCPPFGDQGRELVDDPALPADREIFFDIQGPACKVLPFSGQTHHIYFDVTQTYGGLQSDFRPWVAYNATNPTNSLQGSSGFNSRRYFNPWKFAYVWTLTVNTPSVERRGPNSIQRETVSTIYRSGQGGNGINGFDNDIRGTTNDLPVTWILDGGRDASTYLDFHGPTVPKNEDINQLVHGTNQNYPITTFGFSWKLEEQSNGSLTFEFSSQTTYPFQITGETNPYVNFVNCDYAQAGLAWFPSTITFDAVRNITSANSTDIFSDTVNLTLTLAGIDL